jgi:hypothetical protein
MTPNRAYISRSTIVPNQSTALTSNKKRRRKAPSNGAVLDATKGFGLKPKNAILVD